MWNKEPVIKNIFYEDFSGGIDTSVWEVSNQNWGANNNGTAASNVFYSADKARVEAFGATGGVAVLRSNGDFYQPSGELNKRRQGSALITKRAFGPGRYEVRLKVVPVPGQCSTVWTYYNGGGGANFADYLQNKYSEIDIETFLWADYRNILGVSYQYYHESWDWNTQIQNRRDAVYKDDQALSPYNDGQWHTLSFEWRTDKANGDRAVVWFLDGTEFGRALNWVPEYKATFWIGNWFPDDVSWIGNPLFENAYMYVDWVRITEYDDFCMEGAKGGSGGAATNLGSAAIPLNNYIVNGGFTQALTVKNTKNEDISSWQVSGASLSSGKLTLSGGGRASQAVGAQYAGYSFDLRIDGRVTAGGGKCKVYAEFLSGRTDIVNPTLSVVARSEELYFTAGAREQKTLRFTMTGGHSVQYVRVVIETESGVTAEIYGAEMFLI
jgi:hypothetical protein